MADLRDRYRRDYRSVPIPTAPRVSKPRGQAGRLVSDIGPAAAQPAQQAPALPPAADNGLTGSTGPDARQTAPVVSQAAPVPTPAPVKPPVQSGQTPEEATQEPPQDRLEPSQTPPEGPESPQEPVSDPEQSQAQPASKRELKAAKKAQKQADKQARKQAKKQAKQQTPKGKAHKAKKVALILAGLVVLAGLGAGGAYGYQHVKALGIPVSYVKTSSFPVYYPVNLPDGYYVDTNSFNHQGDAFVFTIKNTSDPNKSVAVSEQTIPQGFNPDMQLPDADSQTSGERGSYTTQVGKGEVGSFQGKQVATLATDKTWIIMNVTSIPASDISGLASSFERVQLLPHLSNKRLYVIKNS